jgi:hypothetical protein
MSNQGDRLLTALQAVSEAERADRIELRTLVRSEASRIAATALPGTSQTVNGQTFAVIELPGKDGRVFPVLLRNGRGVSSLRGTGLTKIVDVAGPAELEAFASEIVDVAEAFLATKRERLLDRNDVDAALRRVETSSSALDRDIAGVLGAATALAERVRSRKPVAVSGADFQVRDTEVGPRLTRRALRRNGPTLCYAAGDSAEVTFTDDIGPRRGRRATAPEIAQLGDDLPDIATAFSVQAEREAADLAGGTLTALASTLRRRNVAATRTAEVISLIAGTAPVSTTVGVGLGRRRRTYSVVTPRRGQPTLAVSGPGLPPAELNASVTSGIAFEQFAGDAEKVAKRMARQARRSGVGFPDFP